MKIQKILPLVFAAFASLSTGADLPEVAGQVRAMEESAPRTTTEPAASDLQKRVCVSILGPDGEIGHTFPDDVFLLKGEVCLAMTVSGQYKFAGPVADTIVIEGKAFFIPLSEKDRLGALKGAQIDPGTVIPPLQTCQLQLSTDIKDGVYALRQLISQIALNTRRVVGPFMVGDLLFCRHDWSSHKVVDEQIAEISTYLANNAQDKRRINVLGYVPLKVHTLKQTYVLDGGDSMDALVARIKDAKSAGLTLNMYDGTVPLDRSGIDQADFLDKYIHEYIARQTPEQLRLIAQIGFTLVIIDPNQPEQKVAPQAPGA